MKKLSLILVLMLVLTTIAPVAFAKGSYLGYLTDAFLFSEAVIRIRTQGHRLY